MLDDTMLIIYGDHGNRMTSFSFKTDIGEYERNRPFFSIRPPNRLKQSVYFKNLFENRHKLVTFYDVHKTLRQVLHWNKFGIEDTTCRELFQINTEKNRDLRGISLFEEISVNRSCREALIENKRCTCVDFAIPTEAEFKKQTGFLFSDAVQKVIEYINRIFDVKRELCEVYKLNNIVKFQMDTNSASYSKSGKIKLKCLFIADPGEAWFQANFNFDIKNKIFVINQAPTRMSKYGKQSSCVDNSFFRNYCFCKKQNKSD